MDPQEDYENENLQVDMDVEKQTVDSSEENQTLGNIASSSEPTESRHPTLVEQRKDNVGMEDTEEKREEKRTPPVLQEIEQWKSYNNYVELEVTSFLDAPDYQIIFTLGKDAIPFHMFANEKWEPLFLTSESSQLEDQIGLINAQLEEQRTSVNEAFTITNLLNMFGLAFNDRRTSQPRASPFTNFQTRTYNRSNDEIVEAIIPTQEDWDEIIMPELRQILNRENFQPYEVEEWIRRVSIQVQRGDYQRALDIIQYDVLGGSVSNPEIANFFSRGTRSRSDSIEQSRKYITIGGTATATERIQSDFDAIREISTSDLGFTAKPSGNDLYHWHLSLHGFDEDSKLGQELKEWASRFGQDKSGQDILIEMKFPSDYPERAPFFRIIRPRFKNLEVNLSLSQDGKSEIEVPQGRGSLTVSRALEKSKNSWNPGTTLIELIQQMRSFIIDSKPTVDIDSGDGGSLLATLGCFWRTYIVVSPRQFGKMELENGGKVILPPSALEELSQFDLERSSGPFGSLSNSSSFETSPWIFEVSASKGKRSFCGIEEFTAQEGFVVVPQWILDNLQTQEGEQVQLRRVSLPKGTYVKLQPHTADFLEVNDTKAMLEWVLPKFVVMSVGDTIVVPFRNRKYLFNILEVKPGKAVHLIDSDVTTEFAPPLTGDIKSYATAETIPASDPMIFGSPKRSSPMDTFATSPKKFGVIDTPLGTSPSKGFATGTSPSKGFATGTLQQQDHQVEGVDYKTCDNCKHKIPVSVYPNHSLSCARRNWFCQACGDAVEKVQKEQHMKDFHTIVYCECGQAMEIRNLDGHKASDCSRRIVRCQFCPLEMPYVENYEHERKCGSQTEKCEICKRYVQKRDLPVHPIDCQKPESDNPFQSSFLPSTSPRGFSFQPPASYSPPKREQRDDIMTCPICDSPYVHLDDLQVHMLTSHDGEHSNDKLESNESEEIMGEEALQDAK